MSTTRWIIETADPTIPKLTRLVVDLDNLPPEAIQRAHQMIERQLRAAFRGGVFLRLEPDMIDAVDWDWLAQALVDAALPAFLSDPEPGDQT